jgi:hypothetical protein
VLPTVFDEPCLYISHTVVTHACTSEEVGETVRTSTGEKQPGEHGVAWGSEAGGFGVLGSLQCITSSTSRRW